jgi:hypothetical protein
MATPRPARNRKSGAANPPRIREFPNARVCLSAARVHASMTWASIMIRTVTPRNTSR